jgi:cytosine deaminase
VLGQDEHTIAVGRRADLCVHRAERVVDLLREHAKPRWVLRGGRVVAESEERSQIHRRTASVPPG